MKNGAEAALSVRGVRLVEIEAVLDEKTHTLCTTTRSVEGVHALTNPYESRTSASTSAGRSSTDTSTTTQSTSVLPSSTTDPGGSVCMVPVHGQHRGRVFLPVADDALKTAEVMAKVLLLARDHEIKDPTILEQIRV